MPRARSRKRWEHPVYKFAYCVERYGNVYTIIKGSNPTAIKNLQWKESNKIIAMKILNDRIKASQTELNINTLKMQTLADAIEYFIETEYLNMNNGQKTKFNSMFKNYLNKDIELNNLLGIRRLVLQSLNNSTHANNCKRKMLQYIKRFINFLIDNDIINKNPIRTIKIKEITDTPIIPTIAEITAITEYLIKNDDEQIALLIQFISIVGTRIMETLKIWWDVPEAPFIKNSEQRKKSIVTGDKIIIDGKRHDNNIANEREIPIDILPGLQELLNKLNKYKNTNNNKLFKWNTISWLQMRLRQATNELGMYNYRFHSFRKFATNYWEKELHIEPFICAYIAGHSLTVRQDVYASKPNADEIRSMINK